MSEVELKSLAYRGELRIAVYSPRKRYLVFTYAEGRAITGHGTCDYFGPLVVPKTITDTLLEGKSANLNGQGAKPLDVRGLSNWQSACPFSSEEAGNLVGWRALELPGSFDSALFMTRMPNQTHGRALFRKVADARPSQFEGNEITDLVDQLVDKFYTNDYGLNYWENGGIGPDELIFHAFAGVGYIEHEEGKGSATLEDSALSPPGKRSDDMAWLLWRVIQAHPELSAKAIWNLLKNEIETAEPRYDTDCILREVRGNEIYWCSTKGRERSLTGEAFENRLSRLRKPKNAENEP